MSYTRVCIHYVWATKHRRPLLDKVCRELLFDHMRENAKKQGICIDRLNGYTDHVHCLVWLQHGQTIDKTALLLKGESSFWFNNRSGIQGRKLQWQNEYFAVSVSLHMVERVRAYIDRQEIHHGKKTFDHEYQELMRQRLVIDNPKNNPPDDIFLSPA